MFTEFRLGDHVKVTGPITGATRFGIVTAIPVNGSNRPNVYTVDGRRVHASNMTHAESGK